MTVAVEDAGIGLFIATYSYFDKALGSLCFRQCFEKEKKSILIQCPSKTTHSIVVASMFNESEIFLPISCNTYKVVWKVSIYAVQGFQMAWRIPLFKSEIMSRGIS